MSDLVSAKEVLRRDEAIAEAAALILSQSGFVCIHKKQARSTFASPGALSSFAPHPGYCDDCPLRKQFTRRVNIELLCTLPKSWSK
jgi:hypothetical protein